MLNEFNAYYKEFCDRVDQVREQQKRDLAQDPNEGQSRVIFTDSSTAKGGINPQSFDALEDVILHCLLSNGDSPTIEKYQVIFEMRLFEFICNPDPDLYLHVRPDGFVVTLEISGREMNGNYKVQARIHGATENKPEVITTIRERYGAWFEPETNSLTRRFSIDAKDKAGEIIDALSPYVTSPWETSAEFLADIDKTTPLPLHIRQMVGLEPCKKDEKRRQSANSAYLVYHDPVKLIP